MVKKSQSDFLAVDAGKEVRKLKGDRTFFHTLMKVRSPFFTKIALTQY
ncbi:MAG: hypothetical protein U7126_13990 [Microcoleus sp.]